MLSAALCKHVRGHSLNIHNITIIPTLQFKASLRIPAQQPAALPSVISSPSLVNCRPPQKVSLFGYSVIHCAVLRADGPFLRSGQGNCRHFLSPATDYDPRTTARWRRAADCAASAPRPAPRPGCR